MTVLEQLKRLLYQTDSVEMLRYYLPMDYYKCSLDFLNMMRKKCQKLIPELINQTVLYDGEYYIITDIDDSDFFAVIKNKKTGNLDLKDVLKLEQ